MESSAIPDWHSGHMPPNPANRPIALLGTAAVVAYAVLAGTQILVLNPWAAAPGRSLAQIHADLHAAGESLGTPWVLAILGLGVALAVGMVVTAWRSRSDDRLMYAFGYLALLELGTPAYWLTSFGSGMALADTYGITGGDHAPWAIPLYVTSGLAFVAMVALGLASLRSRPTRTPGRLWT